MSKLGAKHTIYEKVDRGIDDKEDWGDESQDEDPDWKSPKIRASAKMNLLNDSNLVHVEENAESVAKHKRGDDHHENHREVFILSFPSGNYYVILYKLGQSSKHTEIQAEAKDTTVFLCSTSTTSSNDKG